MQPLMMDIKRISVASDSDITANISIVASNEYTDTFGLKYPFYKSIFPWKKTPITKFEIVKSRWS